jgi:sugar/nucleoside kinase (ribokinase family)
LPKQGGADLPRFLAVGHVSWDRREGGEVLGGSASYTALTAQKLGWDVAVLTSAGPDFEPARDMPGIRVFQRRAAVTTRFKNLYEKDGTRRQFLISRSDDIDLGAVDDEWQDPDVLMLGPLAGEIGRGAAQCFEAGVVGALAQGWLREFDGDGLVTPRQWPDPAADLLGVHGLILSEQDIPDAARAAREWLSYVPIIALTRGWRGLFLHTREGVQDVPSLPRAEVDPTGAGDVFAASFLLRYHETGDLLESAAFGACAASCAVEGVGTSTLGDRAEVERRLEMRRKLIEEGEAEWE